MLCCTTSLLGCPRPPTQAPKSAPAAELSQVEGQGQGQGPSLPSWHPRTAGLAGASQGHASPAPARGGVAPGQPVPATACAPARGCFQAWSHHRLLLQVPAPVLGHPRPSRRCPAAPRPVPCNHRTKPSSIGCPRPSGRDGPLPSLSSAAPMPLGPSSLCSQSAFPCFALDFPIWPRPPRPGSLVPRQSAAA